MRAQYLDLSRPMRALHSDQQVGAEGGRPGRPAPASNLRKMSSVMPREDLDQITTFSEILDSLKNYPSEKESKELSNMTKPKDMMYMAPLGPSQVDIGNLSSR